MKKKIPSPEEFKRARQLYSKLRLKISFVEKHWLMDAKSYEDYLERMKDLARRHKVKVD